MDGIFQTTITILDECKFYPSVISQELERYLPFLTTTRILMEAVKKGVGREIAHKIIKEHSIAVAKRMKEEGLQHNDLADLLSKDKKLGLSHEQIDKAIHANIKELVGTADQQIMNFVEKVDNLVSKHPHAAEFKPQTLL